MLRSWFEHDNSTRTIERSDADQREVDRASAALALYMSETCMFCHRVRRTIARLSLNIELRDINKHAEHFSALVSGGDKPTVPCLRIEDPNKATEWLYESADICAYLEQRFGGASA